MIIVEEKMLNDKNFIYSWPEIDTRIRLIGNNGKVMNLRYTDYANMLLAAKKWGWSPCGVVPVLDDPELIIQNKYGIEGYFLDIHSMVIDSDAKGIADALERMIHEKEGKPVFSI